MLFDPGATDITEAYLRYVLNEIGISALDLLSTVTIKVTPQNLNSPLWVFDSGAIGPIFAGDNRR